jgi:hypothetical protein
VEQEQGLACAAHVNRKAHLAKVDPLLREARDS